MSLWNTIFGRPLRTSEEGKEKLTVLTGVPALGLDALASTAYGPEAALAVLLPLGVAGLHYLPLITIAILALLTTLYLSYLQTAAAYPNGGGAYIVAKDNLGVGAGVLAATALLLDYILNVAVGISAGVGTVVSAISGLQRHTLGLCLAVLILLTLINLRGVRESGLIFVVPAVLFVACLGGAIIFGLVRTVLNGGHPHPVIAPPAVPRAAQAFSLWLLLRAFASGCTAMTGVEAVSNAVPLFQKPTVSRAQWTLTAIVAILGLFLLGIGYLCPAYGIRAMDEQQRGYQTILSQLVAAVAGHNAFYYVSIAAMFLVLLFSAQTSFADFPRVCRLLAEDRFLPPAFANRGKRLVFSLGIIVLAIISGAILIVFGGITNNLIPLFAVGAFSAFLFSQAGMVVHWRHQRGRSARLKLFLNALGATSTCMALLIILVGKFIEGAWITVVIGPALVWLFWRIRHRYHEIAHEIGQPVQLKTWKVETPVVIIPIRGWNRVTERALRFGLEMSDEVTAVHVTADHDNSRHLRSLWKEKVVKPARRGKFAIPRLEILHSPFREIHEPILAFVRRTKRVHPNRLIAVIIPELVEPHWYEYLLHNQHGAALKALLFAEGEQRIVVVSTPWYLRKNN